MRTLLFVALVLVVTACGSKETTDISLEAVAEPKPKPTANTQTPAPVTSEAVAPVATSDTKVADPKAATADADPKEANNKSTASEPKPKEPGSLWSDGSHWNAMFSLRTFRREGDSFLVLPTEAFRNKLSRLVADARKDERGTAQFEERTFILTLREAEEGGTFKVGGSYGFLFGGEPVAVEMKGRVREREIREDDSI
ncbi:MAG: hypothetical protein KDD51_13505, partial [Bdellovibrionales bacterium]|nr:hypothetical protein [Bdellovibrionales bacterium]